MAISKTWDLDIKRSWAITGLIWAVIALFQYLQFYLQHVQSGNTFPWIATLTEFIVNYSSWVPLAALIVWLGKRFRFTRSGWLKPFFVHIFHAS